MKITGQFQRHSASGSVRLAYGYRIWGAEELKCVTFVTDFYAEFGYSKYNRTKFCSWSLKRLTEVNVSEKVNPG